MKSQSLHKQHDAGLTHPEGVLANSPKPVVVSTGTKFVPWHTSIVSSLPGSNRHSNIYADHAHAALVELAHLQEKLQDARNQNRKEVLQTKQKRPSSIFMKKSNAGIFAEELHRAAQTVISGSLNYTFDPANREAHEEGITIKPQNKKMLSESREEESLEWKMKIYSLQDKLRALCEERGEWQKQSAEWKRQAERQDHQCHVLSLRISSLEQNLSDRDELIHLLNTKLASVIPKGLILRDCSSRSLTSTSSFASTLQLTPSEDLTDVSLEEAEDAEDLHDGAFQLEHPAFPAGSFCSLFLYNKELQRQIEELKNEVKHHKYGDAVLEQAELNLDEEVRQELQSLRSKCQDKDEVILGLIQSVHAYHPKSTRNSRRKTKKVMTEEESNKSEEDKRGNGSRVTMPKEFLPYAYPGNHHIGELKTIRQAKTEHAEKQRRRRRWFFIF